MRLFGIVLLLFCCTAAWPATYYVATTGADTNSGAVDAPWATLQHGVDSVVAGDTILVGPGTYAGCRITSSGNADAPCILRAETPGSVLVNSASSSAWHQSNLEAEDCSYWVIDGFESANSLRYGIDVRVSDHVTVRNCHVHSAVVTGIFLAFADYALVENNDTHNNGEHGIYNSNSADYATIRGNRSYSNHGCGSHNNGDISMGGDGVISYETIEKNVFWDNGVGGGAAINCDGVSDSIIRNNLIYGNHAGGLTLYGGDGAECSSRDLVYNNTIIQPSDGRWAINIPVAANGGDNGTANVIMNNIIYNNHSFRGGITVWGAGALAACDYNSVMDRFSADDDNTRITLAQWQALGFDTHSFIATPDQLFADVTNSDYHLKSGSPAIDAGTTVPAVTDDLEGALRPRGNGYDLGCYEAAATPTRFPDVPLSHWAYDEVEACAVAGIVSGFDDGRYQPSWVVNRDAMAVFVSRAFAHGDSNVPTAPISAHFPDVPTDHWAYKYIECAYANNIVMGTGDGTYQPGLPVDRGQMAVFIARAIASPTGEAGLASYTPPPDPSFPDVATGFWAYKHIEYLKSKDVVQGGGDGLYVPDYPVTRDQMAVYVARAFGV